MNLSIWKIIKPQKPEKMQTIQILGVQDHAGTSKLYSNVQQALSDLNLTLEPSMVDDVDQLIDYQIGGIPALVVRGQVVAQQYVPDASALHFFFKAIFLPDKTPIVMNNILVPTDFSDSAKNAFEYAKQLARRCNAAIKVLHVHYPDASAIEAGAVDLYTETLKWKEQSLQHFAQQDPAIIPDSEASVLTKVKTEVAIGFPGDSIVEQSKTEDVDLIVMGTTGESGLFEKVFGSVSSHVSRKAHSPVLLIPNGVKCSDCQNILFATDQKSADEGLIESVPDMFGCPSANVHFVHVDANTETDYKVDRLSFYKPNLLGQFHYVNVESENVLDGLNRYAKDQNIDAIVMVTSHRPFFEELFHKSMTKQMALTTNKPLLIMHYDD